MKKKFKVLVAFSLLTVCMSSCVYSLFPIYTEDTLVYYPDLIGKWKLEGESEYLIFEPGFDLDGTISVSNTGQSSSNDGKVKVSKNLSISFGDDEFIMVDGDTVRDKERIKAYYQEELSSTMDNMGEALGEVLKGMTKVVKNLSRGGKPFSFSTDDQSYRMTIVDGDEEESYRAHLAQIGEDLFLDLFPIEGDFTDNAFNSMVWFPVHMFMKIEINENGLKLIQFDLDKMNKLFESNLIRIGHENVDGTILMTAKSEELQKFLDRYSNDESVFDEVSDYNKVIE